MIDKSTEAVKVYDKISRKYAEIFDKDFSDNPYLDKFLSYLHRGDKILDLGCGTGRITQYYVDNGFKVIGIDLSDEMIKIAKKKHPQIEFLCADMRKLNFPNESFDAVSIAYSLFHLSKKDVPQLIKKVKYILKDKEILLLILQEGNGEIYVDEPLAPGTKLFLNLYSENEIIDILNENGFEILSTNRKIPEKLGGLPYNKLILITRRT